MVRNRRAAFNPLDHLDRFDEAQDRRRIRRPLSTEEAVRVLTAARSSLSTFRGLTGRDREALYLLGFRTGIRPEELSTLTPEAFDLASDQPTVRVAASATKNGKEVYQPLPNDVADFMADYLKRKPNRLPVWPGDWFRKAANMIRTDL